MGQDMSCAADRNLGLSPYVRIGDLEVVKAMVEKNPSILAPVAYKHDSPLHVAAASGHLEILCFLLQRLGNPDVLNRQKQTPLMLAAMNGKLECLEKLIEAGGNILKFDSIDSRTCLHFAAYYGHSDCLVAILSAAQSSHIASSWGYARFVNVRDLRGATPLHLAARQSRPECLRILLHNGALTSSSTGGSGRRGTSPLHSAAKGGSLECVRELLSWGANRHQRDASGRTPYTVALKHKHVECAALLNPAAIEPLIWPSPLKLISELNEEAKALMRRALIKVNRQRENANLAKVECLPDDAASEVSEAEVCGICYEEACRIEVKECGHRMCPGCTLVLCCNKKPSSAAAASPKCPFCRSTIDRLAIIEAKNCDETQEEDDGLRALPATFGKIGAIGSANLGIQNDCGAKV